MATLTQWSQQFGDIVHYRFFGLPVYLLARDEDGSMMTDKQLRDEVITLLLAGHETTALTLSWTWYLLVQHPEVEKRLHEELDVALGGRLPGKHVLCLPTTLSVENAFETSSIQEEQTETCAEEWIGK